MTTSNLPPIYCLKCRTHTDSIDPQPVVLKNGRNAVTSICAVCQGKKFRMGNLTQQAGQ